MRPEYYIDKLEADNCFISLSFDKRSNAENIIIFDKKYQRRISSKHN